MVAPTLTEPLPRAADLRAPMDPALWTALVERPIGELIEASSADDAVRGVLLTDALIGTFSYAHDPSLRQNRCFLYHVIGNGTGEWRVPVGGMGAVAAELTRAAIEPAPTLRTDARVVRDPAGRRRPTAVRLADGEMPSRRPGAGQLRPGRPAPAAGRTVRRSPVGSQIKINMLVRRLPRLRVRLDPQIGFAGTLHLGQGYARLQQAYERRRPGGCPTRCPARSTATR